MKTLSFIYLLIMIHICSYGQLFEEDSLGKSLFESGSNLIKIGDYKKADSLLTIALCTYKNENVYYNKAIARLMLNDTSGFCLDMNYAANKYFDIDAAKLFNTLCCKKIDTIFYDNKLNTISNQKYRYYEEIRDFKYEEKKIGIFHDLNSQQISFNIDYSCGQSIISMDLLTTDIIAVYEYKDTSKYYYKTTKAPAINNLTKYNIIKDRAKYLFLEKYGYLKSDKKTDINVLYEIMISSQGDITEIRYVGIYPEKDIGDAQIMIEKDITDIVNDYPSITPASFKSVKVNSVIYDSIVY